jgi:hypothetical protein
MHFLSRLFSHLDARRNGPLKGDDAAWEKPQRFNPPKPEKRKRPGKADKAEKRARPEMAQQKPDRRRGQRPPYLSTKPSLSSTSSTASDSSRQVYSMAALETQISKNLDPLLKWAAEREFSAENIVFLRAVRDFRKKWTMIAKQEQQRQRPARSGRRPLGRSRAYYTAMQQRHDDGPPPNGAIDDRCLAPELRRERYEDAALIWFQLVNPLTARFNINIDYRTYTDLEALFHGLRWQPFCSDPHDDDCATSSSRSDKSDNMVAPWDDYEPERAARARQRASSAVPLSDVDRLYKIPVTEIVVADDGDGDGDGASAFVDDGATLSTAVETERLRVPAGFGIDVFDRAYESVKTDVFLNTWPNYEAAFAVRCSGPARHHRRRDGPERGRNACMEDGGLLRRAADRMLGRR